jgi:hypothetical protein
LRNGQLTCQRNNIRTLTHAQQFRAKATKSKECIPFRQGTAPNCPNSHPSSRPCLRTGTARHTRTRKRSTQIRGRESVTSLQLGPRNKIAKHKRVALTSPEAEAEHESVQAGVICHRETQQHTKVGKRARRADTANLLAFGPINWTNPHQRTCFATRKRQRSAHRSTTTGQSVNQTNRSEGLKLTTQSRLAWARAATPGRRRTGTAAETPLQSPLNRIKQAAAEVSQINEQAGTVSRRA